MPDRRSASLAVLAVLLLCSPLLATEVLAMPPRFRVVSFEGAQPAPQVGLRQGQELPEEGDTALPAGSTLVLLDDVAGQLLSVRGPNRLSVKAGRLEASDPGLLTQLERGYFADAPTAVKQTARWLDEGAFVQLALHYDLSGTQIPLSSLVSGAFFLASPHEGQHPGGLDRFKQPFSPRFSYDSHRQLAAGELEVTVRISIDQGDGMVQQGRDTFRLRQSPRGLQLLPRLEPGRR